VDNQREYWEQDNRRVEQEIAYHKFFLSLVEQGWHKYQLSRYMDNHHAIDIREWVEANCQGLSEQNGREWYFELAEDAVLFTLKWAG
jgi:hypothetical protein